MIDVLTNYGGSDNRNTPALTDVLLNDTYRRSL